MKVNIMDYIIGDKWLYWKFKKAAGKVKTMKFSTLILLFSVCCALNAQNGNLNMCRWHISDKIETSDYQLIRKAKLYCFLSNDNENIYVCLKIVDQKIQTKILKEGLKIWINMDGRELKQMGIRFPIGSQNQSGHRKTDHSENDVLPEGHTDDLISLANTIELMGFTWEQERHFPSENRDNFRGSVRYDDAGILYYKMVMPIAKLPVRNSKVGHSAMPFTLGIEYGSVPVLNKQGLNRGPAPSSIFRSGASHNGATKVSWINNVKLATSK
jgi:hypothetical protein